MHLTVVILARSNQLLPNLFLPDKNKELPNQTCCPLYPSRSPPARGTCQDRRTSSCNFFLKAEPHSGLSQMTNLFSKDNHIRLKHEIWQMDCLNEINVKITTKVTERAWLCLESNLKTASGGSAHETKRYFSSGILLQVLSCAFLIFKASTPMTSSDQLPLLLQKYIN